MAAETQQIIRLVETNLDGKKVVGSAIRSIPGVSFMFSNAIVKLGGFKGKKIGELSEEEMKKLESMLTNPSKYNIPRWLFNRRNEPATAEDKHLTASTLDFTMKMDINEMKKMKTYKGQRHAVGLPVRGQKTRSSFRHGKSVGVSRTKGKPGGK